MLGDCRFWRDEIEDARAALSPGALAHLPACAACSEARRDGERLSRLVGDLGRVSAPPDFDFRLRARLAERRASRPYGSPAPRYAYGLAAAVVCVALLASATYLRRPVRQAVPDQGVAMSEMSSAAPAESKKAPVSSATAATVAGSLRGPDDTADVSSRVVRRPAPPAYARPAQGRASTGANTDRRVPASGLYADVRVASVDRERVTDDPSGQLAIPVGSAGEPLRVLLRDERGGARHLPMRAVSFGAQQVVARERGSVGTSAGEQEGVW